MPFDAEIDAIAHRPDDYLSIAPNNLFRRHLPRLEQDEKTGRDMAVATYNQLSAELAKVFIAIHRKMSFHAVEVDALAEMPGGASTIRLYSGDMAHWLRLARQILDADNLDNPSSRGRAMP